MGRLRRVQGQDDHRTDLHGQGGGVLLPQLIRNSSGEDIGPSSVKGQLAAVIDQRNGNTLAVMGQGPCNSRGCSMLHGQADRRRFVLMQFFQVGGQGEGQVRDNLDCHGFGRKLPALGILGDSGEDVVPSTVKGERPAVGGEGHGNLLAVPGQCPADGFGLAALHRQADLRRLAVMHLLRAGGHGGDDHRQDGDGLAGGVLLPGGVREGSRQGVLARLGQSQCAAVLGEAGEGLVCAVLRQRPDHGAVQVIF